jgi:hypothetical protein
MEGTRWSLCIHTSAVVDVEDEVAVEHSAVGCTFASDVDASRANSPRSVLDSLRLPGQECRPRS